MTRLGSVVRSDHVGHLNADGREALLQYGIGLVIDLRTPAELQRSPNPFAGAAGIRYLNAPIVDDATMQALGDAPDMFGRYLMMLDRRPAAFAAVFQAIADSERPVLFHCFAGKDRTGLVAAMLLALNGVGADDIAADFGETDRSLALKYEQWLAEAAPERRSELRDELCCPPERIHGVLDHLRRRWGGVADYLEAAGMPAAAIEQAAGRLG